jgi:hypothetical protein
LHLRFANELVHRLTRLIEQLLAQDDTRPTDDVVLRMLLAPRIDKVAEQLGLRRLRPRNPRLRELRHDRADELVAPRRTRLFLRPRRAVKVCGCSNEPLTQVLITARGVAPGRHDRAAPGSADHPRLSHRRHGPGPARHRHRGAIATTDLLAELGIVFLLFTLGLEFSFPRMLAMRGEVFGLGAAQVTLTVAVVAVIARLLGVPWLIAVVVGGAIAMSSTAIILHELTDRAELNRTHGRLAFSMLLFQDLAFVPLSRSLPRLRAAAPLEFSLLGDAACFSRAARSRSLPCSPRDAGCCGRCST